MPQDTYSRRRRRLGSVAGPAADLSTAGTLVDRFKVEDVPGKTADTKFILWPNAVLTETPTYDLNVANNGGLTYRANPTGFGTCAAAEVAATTDGLYQSFGHSGGAQPFTFVAFGKLAAAGSNGDVAVGNVVGVPSNTLLSKLIGFWGSEGQGGNSVFWQGGVTDTTVKVYTMVFSGASSTQWVNTTLNNTGNGGTQTRTGTFGIGKNAGGTGALSLWNEAAIFQGDVSNRLSDVILPYFRSKSGLALL